MATCRGRRSTGCAASTTDPQYDLVVFGDGLLDIFTVTNLLEGKQIA